MSEGDEGYRSEEERLAAESFESKLKGDLVRKREDSKSILRGTLINRHEEKTITEEPATVTLKGTLIEKTNIAPVGTDSKLRIHPSLMTTRETATTATEEKTVIAPETHPDFPTYERFYNPPEQEELTPEIQQQRVKILVDYLKDHVQPLKERYGSYAALLSGETELNTPTYDHTPDTREISKQFDYTNGGMDISTVGREKQKGVRDIHRWYYTGRDVGWLKTEHGNDSWKYYLSLNQSSDELKAAGKQLLHDLLTRCSERKLSIKSKSMDHNYDSFNIYTFDKDGMGETLNELYDQYKDSGIFAEVPHFFQEHVGEVPQTIMGRVHEPAGGFPVEGAGGTSHSIRMALLGKRLDQIETRGQEITPENWIAACDEIGIKPEAPWDVDISRMKGAKELRSSTSE